MATGVCIVFCPQWRSIFHSQAYRPKRRIDAAAGYRGHSIRSAMLPNYGRGRPIDINVVGKAWAAVRFSLENPWSFLT